MLETKAGATSPGGGGDGVAGPDEDVEGHGAREVVAGLGVVIALSSGAALVTSAEQAATVSDGPVSAAGSTRRGAVATETRVVSAAPRAFAGQVVTFTAAVAAQELRDALPTGTIVFLDGQRELGRAPLGQGGTASVTISDLPAGEHAVSAVFSGDDVFTTSEADPISQRVMRASTVTTLRTDESDVGSVTLIATVGSTSPSGVVPTGTVSFWSDAEQMGATPVQPDGTASLIAESSMVLDRHVYARYAGDMSNRASQSNSASTSAGSGAAGASVDAADASL